MKKASFQTLVEMITAVSNDGANGIYFVEAKEDIFLSYQSIFDNAKIIAGNLQSLGLKKKDELIFQLEDNREFISCFWACLLIGVIPVPLSLGISEGQRNKLGKVWKKLNNPYLITNQKVIPKLQLNVGGERMLEFEQVLNGMASSYEANIPDPEDIAFVQFSSGSTGNPKGVALTHKNLLTNVQDIHEGIHSPESGDFFYSWMPLTHDMGLIGFHLTPLLMGWTHWIMPTPLFIRNPVLWLRKIHEYRISFTSSPNFGYSYTLKHLERFEADELELDLSSLRIIVNGAEPISAELCYEFNERMKVFGLKPQVIFPVYGLAEASLAVTFSNPEECVQAVSFGRDKLGVGDQVYLESENGASFVDVGVSLSHCNIKITDFAGNLVEDGTVGNIEISGGNVTRGYYNDPDVSRSVIDAEGWLNTGDLGVVFEKRLYITGRAKDVLFVNGQNYYSHDVERCLEVLDGLELGKAVVTGFFDSNVRRERIVAFVLHKGNMDQFVEVVRSVKSRVFDVMGFEVDLVLPTRKISKTTSGKVQRFAMLELYRSGEYSAIEHELNDLLEKSTSSINNYTEDLNDTEQRLVQLWKKVLNHSEFGPDQSFFHVGGNSLKIGELAVEILETIEVEPGFSELFENNTIRSMAALINSKPKVVSQIIPERTLKNEYTLSLSQSRMFYFWKMNPDSVAYNNVLAVEVSACLDEEKIRKQLQDLVERHAILRTVFHLKDGIPLQTELVSMPIELEACLEEENIAEQLKNNIRPFDLLTGPLFRVTLVRKESSSKTILLLEIHHIISDGTSVVYFLEEILRGYGGEKIATSPIQFLDISEWKLQQKQDEQVKEYWVNELKNYPKLDLPIDFDRPAIYRYEGKKNKIDLDPTYVKRIRNVAGRLNVSEFILLLSVYKLFLAKYGGQDDLVVGIPVSGRIEKESLRAQGMFVNNLAIRSQPEAHKSIAQFIGELSNKIYQSFDHQSFDFSDVVAELGGKRTMSRNPIFDTMFVYQNMDFHALKNWGDGVRHFSVDPGYSKFDLSLEVLDFGDDLSLHLEYNTNLFRESTAVYLSELFIQILGECLENPERMIKDTGKRNFNRALIQGKQTPLEMNESVYSVFEKTARENGKAVALEVNNQKITYNTLLQRVELLSTELMRSGIGKGSNVSILMDRSLDLVTSVFAVLRAGGCFVPVEPNLPENRLKYIHAAAQIDLVLTQRELANESLLGSLNLNVLYPEELNYERNSESFDKANVDGADLAYMIFTSGTTGNPKGVMIEHHSILNYSRFAQATYFKEPDASIALYSSISFDLTITSIIPPLLSGNPIVIYANDPDQLLIEKVLKEDKVDIVKLTPSHLKIVRDSVSIGATPNRLKRFIVGGENLSVDLASSIDKKYNGIVELFNEYGPTEATVGCMIHQFRSEENESRSVSIGYPINNTAMIILDQQQRPVPQLAIGELYVSGEGIARGYYNQSDLTAERFIELEGMRFYATGDFVREHLKGTLEYIGRKDNQVKLNGYRVELEEVEAQLRAISGVEEAVVVVLENDQKDHQLCAYLKKNNAALLDDTVIRQELARAVPNYMIPSFLSFIDEIPLTSNGKVDISRLEPPAKKASNVREDLSRKEKELIQIWESVLNVDGISKSDNFFELGGDSIKAVQIVSKLYDLGYNADVSLIIKNPCVQSVAELLSEKKTETYQQGAVSGEILYTPAAEWFFTRKLEHPEYFNQSVLLELNAAEISKQLVQNALNKLLEMHDGLRMNHNSSAQRLFFNPKHLTSGIELLKYTVNQQEKEARLLEIGREVKGNFSLEEDLLIKCAWIDVENESPLLLITCHHLVIDGISWRIILDDLYTLLKQKESHSMKTASLINWSEFLRDENTIKQLNSGDNQFSEFTHYKQVAEIVPGQVINRTLELGPDETDFIVNGAHTLHGIKPDSLLLTAVLRAENSYSDNEEKLVELERHGRSVEGINISRTVGWFTSIFPQLIKLESTSIEDDLLKVKECIQGVQSDGIGFTVTHASRFWKNIKQVGLRFNFLGTFDFNEFEDLFTISKYATGGESSSMNHATAGLEVNAMVIDHKMQLDFAFDDNRYTEREMDLIMDRTREEIKRIISYLSEVKEVKFTPSDFSMANLDQEDLDSIFSEDF